MGPNALTRLYCVLASFDTNTRKPGCPSVLEHDQRSNRFRTNSFAKIASARRARLRRDLPRLGLCSLEVSTPLSSDSKDKKTSRAGDS